LCDRHYNYIYIFSFPGLCSQEEERLVRDLFRGYNKLIRPVQNMTQKVEVAFGLAFIQLINVVSGVGQIIDAREEREREK
jgi:hypothetical protein